MKGSLSNLGKCRLLLIGCVITLGSSCVHADFIVDGDYIYTTNSVGQATITGFNPSYSGELSITNTLGGCPVTAIGNNAFRACSGLTSVIVPDSVTDIGDWAFCFTGDVWIGYVDDGPSYELLDIFIFGGNNLTSVTFGNGVTRIGRGAFNFCTSLTNVTIPGSVTNIEDYAFSTCTNLTTVTLGNSVTRIGDCAFEACSSLTSVTIPASVNNIGDYAFSWCSRLSSISITGSITNIGDCAFQYCKSLASIAIPSGVTRIGYCAFFRCPTLTTITVDTNNSYYCSLSGILFTRDTKTLVQCPGGKAGSATIPSSATNILDAAFAGCTQLTDILFKGNPPTYEGEYVFYDTPATVYYLPGAHGWGATFDDLPTLCWNPVVKSDTAFGYSGVRFGFNVAGTTNIPVVVEACTNLSAGIWEPLTNTTLGTAGSIYFTDPASSNLPMRFYRVNWP